MNEANRIEKELNRNQLFSKDTKNFYINKRSWDNASKQENGKILNSKEHAPRTHLMTSEGFDDIIGTSYHVADSPRFKGL